MAETQSPSEKAAITARLEPFVWVMGAATALVLLLMSARYGYHRDELYFLLCAQNLAWGYVDQGPITPFLAWIANSIAEGNLPVLRTPSALMAAGSVVTIGAIARELGACKGAQIFAAALASISGIVLATGHLLSTSTLDLLVWLLASFFAIRMLRTNDTKWALPLGAVIGLGMLNKPLPALLAISLIIGVAIAGPRKLLLDRRVLVGAALAILLALPNLLWQAVNGFPQLSVASDISSGDSSYSGRVDAIILQFLIISPLLVPVWVAGLVAVLRRAEWRAFRPIAIAWIVAFILVVVGGGKGYYDAPLLLVLTAAGAVVTHGWCTRGARVLKKGLVTAMTTLTAVSSAILLLPVLPANDLPDFVVAANYDAGETIGWPEFVDSVARVYNTLPDDEKKRTVILTANYGEAGAIARYGASRALPKAYSGHNSMADFAVPPDSADVVIAVGFERPVGLQRLFKEVERAGHVDLGSSIDNDENNDPIFIASGMVKPWSEIWDDEIRHAG
jgi:4-amino-4-deoxy-L-arabinose transferase-like glycosyltransferase